MIETRAVPRRDGLLHDLLPTPPFLLRSGQVMLAVGIGGLLLGGLLAWLLPVPLEARIAIRAAVRTCGATRSLSGTVLLVLCRRTCAFHRAGRAQEAVALVVLSSGTSRSSRGRSPQSGAAPAPGPARAPLPRPDLRRRVRRDGRASLVRSSARENRRAARPTATSGTARLQEHEAGPEWGVPLGVDIDGRLLRSAPFQPLLIPMGEPCSGKTRRVMMPIVVWWPGSALVVSARADLMRLTRQTRSLGGRVLVWDPSGLLRGAEAEDTVAFDLLSLCRTWQGAKDVAAMLAAAASTSDLNDQNFWVGPAQAVLAVRLFAAALNRLILREVMRFDHLRDTYETRALPATVDDEHDVETAQELLESFEQADDRTAQGVALTEVHILMVFGNPAALAAASGTPDFAEELQQTGTTVYVVAPATLKAQFAPLISIVLDHY